MNTPVFSSRRSVPIAGKLPCVVCCTPTAKSWQLRLPEFDERPRQWHFCNAEPVTLLEQLIRWPDLAVMRASWQAIQFVKRNRADLLVTSNPSITLWCALFAFLQSVRVDHVALSFYLPKLPRGLGGVLAQLGYSAVNKFIVHSRTERQLYSDYFGMPMAQFEMQHWGSNTPTFQPSEPLEPGEYICAIGDQLQDYQTLMAAIATLPHIPLVLILPPGKAIRADIPPHVRVRVGLTKSQQTNILSHSRFLVLPVRHPYTPCDHQTLVTAMQFGKTFIIPDLPSVSDYAFHNSNAVVYQLSDPQSLAGAIEDLWKDIVKCEVLGANGQEFAKTFCSQTATFERFQQLLFRRGL